MIPSLIRWAAYQPNPWSIPDAKFAQALQTICDEFYGDLIDLEVTTSSAAFRIVSTYVLMLSIMSHYYSFVLRLPNDLAMAGEVSLAHPRSLWSMPSSMIMRSTVTQMRSVRILQSTHSISTDLFIVQPGVTIKRCFLNLITLKLSLMQNRNSKVSFMGRSSPRYSQFISMQSVGLRGFVHWKIQTPSHLSNREVHWHWLQLQYV